jgi:hypothetical protein
MGWLTGWKYRKSHVINSASGAGTNYQVRIVAHCGSGTDSGQDVYLYNHCRLDFGDVRFTRNDGTTLLDYWIELKFDGDYAVFWVEIADDLSSANATIYIYYGKSDATTTSNGANTFPYFDDFSTDTSNDYEAKVNTPSWSVANGRMTITGTTNNNWNILGRRNLTFQNLALDVYVYSVTSGVATYETAATVIRITSSGRYQTETDTDASPNNTKIAQYYTPVSYLTGDLSGNIAGHVVTLAGYGTTLKYFLDYDLRGSGTGASGGNVAGQVGFGVYRTTVTPTLVIEWAKARKYVEPEPAHGAWGQEELYAPITNDFPLHAVKRGTAQELINKF